MPAFQIYVTEPEVIDLDVVREVLGGADYNLIAGSTDFSVGDASICNTVLIRSGTHVDATTKEKMPNLQHVVRVGVGLDNVDLAFCEQNGVAVYNAPGANAEAVAEYAVAVILLALRNIHLLERSDLETWNRFKFSGTSIASRTVGIVGFGHIGKLLFQKLQALGCKDFLLYDPYVTEAPEGTRMAELDELLSESDVISLHLPLLPATEHIINAGKLSLLKENAILLNAARGGIVDEAAVVAALTDKQFTYIADAVEGEPQVNPALLDQPNILITPHIASLTDDAEKAMARVAVQNLVDGKQAAKLPA
ncbi:MAG TPA: NAD(P)-dependent oxidoreductase [Candidatus Saccharimonadales bacterium]|nr:NAD(P)-dependent oxidoreductase [Candidatus Saccharimonadales bacterium]